MQRFSIFELTVNFIFLLIYIVSVKWSGKKFDNIEFDPKQSPLEFKTQIYSLTGVVPERQKIMIKGGMLKVRKEKCLYLGIQSKKESRHNLSPSLFFSIPFSNLNTN